MFRPFIINVQLVYYIRYVEIVKFQTQLQDESRLFLTLLLYFIFIFYLPQFTIPDFPFIYLPGFLAIFWESNNNNIYFIFIFYLPRFTLPDFPSIYLLFLAIFIMLSSNNNNIHFIIFIYLPRFTVPDFFSIYSQTSLPFLSCCH